jgi:ABC-2 type transport system permease protein
MPRFLAVIEKDLTVFLRSPTQWAQGVIILALLAIYMGSLHNYPQMFDFPFWKVVVSFINFAFVAYNMSVLSTRFVFPSMSLEGRTLWLLRSAPLSPSRLLLEKIALSLVTSLVLGEFLIVVSNFLLKAEAFMLVTSAVGTLVFAVSLSFLSVSLGALFPDFKERNPGRIASGPGGILCAMACLGLVAITVALVAWPTYHLILSRANQVPFPLGITLLAVSGALLLNVLAAGVPFTLAVRSLGRRDY